VNSGDFDTVFIRRMLIFIGKFMARGSIVCFMNTMILRARAMSLALLVIAVVDHGHLQADYSGATPGSGLVRLGRDLMRRAGWEVTAEPTVSESSSRNRRSRAVSV
jgi:hypothetical protein